MFGRHVRTFALVVVVALLVACSAAALLAQAQAPKNILLVGWDGCQRDHLKEMIARSEVPNLIALAAKGNLVAIDILRTTDTKAGWAQILTGYEPEKTGVFNNGRFRPIPVGYTAFERLEQFFGPDNIYTAAVIGKLHHVGAAGPGVGPVGPTGATLRRRARQQQPAAEGAAAPGQPAPAPQQLQRRAQARRQPSGGPYGEPYYLTKDHMDLFQEGLGVADNVGARALQVLDEHGRDRFFMFIHFAEPDHPGHAHGENSQQYTDSVKHDDEWLGKIIAKLQELGVRDQTLIYVTADHGFDEGMTSHGDAPYVWLATDDPLVARRGLREDVAPTILWRFGVDLSKLDPPLDGHPLQQPYQPPIW
jgi:hypothetical protein